MDFKYKHFHQQRLYSASPEEVFDRARAVMADSVGWTITKETSGGLTAEGSSFGHAGIASIQIRSTAAGTLVEVELRMQRAGFGGFMLFDVGGYYNIQIRKWLDAIQASLHQQATGQAPPPAPPLQSRNKTAACAFNGCLILIAITIAIYFLVTFICAVIGLTTGNLLLIGRGGDIRVHGWAARAISAVILLFGAWIMWRIVKRPRARSAIS